MTALFLTYAYPPLRYPRSIQISRLTRHMRRPVRVVCASEPGADDATIAPDVGAAVERIERVPNSPLRGRLDRVVRRVAPRLQACPDPYLGWARAAAQHVQKADLANGAEVLVTFGQPMSCHLAGLTLKSETGLPWAAHFSDPWADNPLNINAPAVQAKHLALERRVIDHADLIVFTSDETRDLVMAKYPADWREKTRVLPHAFDPALFPDAAPDETALVLRHIGNFYGARGPDALFQALVELAKRPGDGLADVRFELVGYTRRASRHDDLLRQVPAGTLSFKEPVDYATSLALMKHSHGLLVIDAPARLSVFFPSKLADYIGSGRPVLGITPDGTSARHIASLGGYVADPADPVGIADMLQSFLAQQRNNRHRSEPWGNDEYRQQFDAEFVTAQFEDLLSPLIDETMKPAHPGLASGF